MGFERMQFLAGCWTEGLSSKVATGHRLPSLPCGVGPPYGSLLHLTQQKKQSTESVLMRCKLHWMHTWLIVLRKLIPGQLGRLEKRMG